MKKLVSLGWKMYLMLELLVSSCLASLVSRMMYQGVDRTVDENCQED